MKLLFDQNLSPRLPRLLSDLFPGSVHAREAGLTEADDTAIWDYAKVNGFVIVSKDSDFQQRSLLLGARPSSSGCDLAIALSRTVSICFANTLRPSATSAKTRPNLISCFLE
jgi:predicted nuclease of predicted toxin-antitoxin system